jgi:hypothetical protein
MKHAVAVGADDREVAESGRLRAGDLGQGDEVVALDVTGAVRSVDGLEVEPAYLAGQQAGLRSNCLLLALGEPRVAFPYAVPAEQDAAFLGFVLTVLGCQWSGLLPCCFGTDRFGEGGEPLWSWWSSSHTLRSSCPPCCMPVPG